MELIERYLYAIGRHLPAKHRGDILAELRSVLHDTLEARVKGEPSEAEVAAVIKELGRPTEVAASYHPQNQYLIGPELFPTFKIVVGIVFTAIISVQLVLILFATLVVQEPFSTGSVLWDVFGGLPWAIGCVVLIFAAIQYFSTEKALAIENEKDFDPYKLPQLIGIEPVNRIEKVISIMFSVFFLVILARFYQEGGFSWVDGSGFFENPVVDQYFPWLALAMVADVVMDVILLWQGRWQTSTRLAVILLRLFGVILMFVLIQGHDAWLAQAGFTDGNFIGMTHILSFIGMNNQIAGMILLRGFFSFVIIVSIIDPIVQTIKLIWMRYFKKELQANQILDGLILRDK